MTRLIEGSYIKFGRMVEEVVGCLYNATDGDKEWLESFETDSTKMEIDDDVKEIDQEIDEIDGNDGIDVKVNDDVDDDVKEISGDVKEIEDPKKNGVVTTDHEDEVPTQSKIELDDFEKAMFLLDQIGNEKNTDQPDLAYCLNSIDKEPPADKPSLDLTILTKIYEYWKQNRYISNFGLPLRPLLKAEDMSADPDHDPYVCFRRREIKTLRKVRRSDTLALDKLKNLLADLGKVSTLLGTIHEREVARKDLLALEWKVFEGRIRVRRVKKWLGINSADTLDASPVFIALIQVKRRRLDPSDRKHTSGLREVGAIIDDVEASSEKIEEKVRRAKAILDASGWEDCTEMPDLSAGCDSAWGEWLGIEREAGMHVSTRRRVGRGGRIVFDRQLRRGECLDDRGGDLRRIEEVRDTTAYGVSYFRGVMYRVGVVGRQPGLFTQMTHDHSFDPSKVVVVASPQFEVIRPTVTVPKRRVKVTEKIVATPKKKTAEEIKQAQVKEYLKIAQKQAQKQFESKAGVTTHGIR